MENKIYPCLWFDGNGKEAAIFYCSVFRNTTIVQENEWVVMFESAGQRFMCLNLSPSYPFTPAISFYVLCESEEEVSSYWEKLLPGGKVMMPLDKYDWSPKYGWLQDRFGVSWQLALGKMEDVGQKFTPSLMFTGNQVGKAEEAMLMYTSVFKQSEVVGMMRYGAGQKDEGLVAHEQFKLNGHVFMGMESSMAHHFGFTEAVSLVVNCENQEEIDWFWERLTLNGQEGKCGWLKDKYGVSWQIVPTVLGKLMSDPERAKRVQEAFLKMKKFNIQELTEA